jgi:hypothetical protein
MLCQEKNTENKLTILPLVEGSHPDRHLDLVAHGGAVCHLSQQLRYLNLVLIVSAIEMSRTLLPEYMLKRPSLGTIGYGGNVAPLSNTVLYHFKKMSLLGYIGKLG